MWSAGTRVAPPYRGGTDEGATPVRRTQGASAGRAVGLKVGVMDLAQARVESAECGGWLRESCNIVFGSGRLSLAFGRGRNVLCQTRELHQESGTKVSRDATGIGRKGELVKLANIIFREHGQPVNQKIAGAVFLATGKTLTRTQCWKWLRDEYVRRHNLDVATAKKEITPYVAPKAPKRDKREFYTTDRWRALRFDALKSANGYCCLCGRSQRQHGVVLHVDHIKPRSRFPALEYVLSNLQVLCEDCNLGKSNRDDTDWR